MAGQSDWSCDANDALQINLVQPGETSPTTVATFHPQFTYPIFGDDERIFGYKGLIIRLRLTTHDMRSHVYIKYDEKFKTVGDTAALDLKKTMRDWLPKSAFSGFHEYEMELQKGTTAKDFRPPGEIIHSYTDKGRNFEIWAGSLADEGVRKLLERAQVLIPLFIEGGTAIDTEDLPWTLERWTVYYLYEKVTPPTPNASQYSMIGYATTYRYWFYTTGEKPRIDDGKLPLPPEREPQFSDFPSRLRISQFLILPPYQGNGHGTRLYNVIHNACMTDSSIQELTVEDPNESFDQLRDQADYATLKPEFVKHNIAINPDPYPPDTKRRPRRMPTSALIPVETLSKIRSQYKIQPTQFAHILETFLLEQIPVRHRLIGGANIARLLIKKWKTDDENDRRYYWWRMLVKQRLYRRSRDVLMQLDLAERIQKLEETVSNVEEGYEKLLKDAAKREDKKRTAATAAEASTDADVAEAEQIVAQRTKRKFAVVEEDDEEGSESDAAKRAKA